MNDWQIFSDPKFKIYFKYPDPTPQGYSVEKAEGQREDAIRVHLSSPQSQELYFEVTRFVNLAPKEEYQRHKDFLTQQFENLSITDLEESQLETLAAQTYTFAWPEKERKVVLVQKDQATYRILYDPRSALNTEVLATLKLL